MLGSLHTHCDLTGKYCLQIGRGCWAHSVLPFHTRLGCVLCVRKRYVFGQHYTFVHVCNRVAELSVCW